MVSWRGHHPSFFMEWRPIPTTAGYQASSDGQIKSPDTTQTLVSSAGKEYTRERKGRILSPAKHSAGYRKVVVITLDGRQSQRTVHSLVMEAFEGLRPVGLWINHKNGDKTDNRIENLEYCSASDNQRHAVATGLAPKPPLKRGTDQHKAVLDEDQVRCIRRQYEDGMGIASLARQYMVGESTIRNVVKRHTWTWLDD